MLQAGCYIQFGWPRVSPQTILQLNHTRVHNPQAASLSLPPHSFQWAVIVTSLVSGGGGWGGGSRQQVRAQRRLLAAFRRRAAEERSGAMGKLQEFDITFTNNKVVYGPGESISGTVKIRTAHSLQYKGKLPFLTCLKQRERNIFLSAGVPLAARVSGARRQSPDANKLFLRDGGQEEEAENAGNSQPPGCCVFFFGQFSRSFIVWPWKMWCVGSITDFGGAALGVDGAFPPLHMRTSPRLVVPFQVVGVGSAVTKSHILDHVLLVTTCCFQELFLTKPPKLFGDVVGGWHATNKAQQQVLRHFIALIRRISFVFRSLVMFHSAERHLKLWLRASGNSW